MRNDELFSRLQNLINYEPQQKEIIAKTGISQSTLSTKKTRNSNWSDEEIQKLNRAYNIDIYKETSGFIESNDCVSIPIRGNLSISMGYGIEVVDESKTATYPVPRKLIRSLGIIPDLADYVPAEGDSMEPTISGGSLLLVDRTRKEVIDGKIYCVRLNHRLMAKRLQFIPPNKVAVISDNPKYRSFDVDLSVAPDFDFSIIGEVRRWETLAR